MANKSNNSSKSGKVLKSRNQRNLDQIEEKKDNFIEQQKYFETKDVIFNSKSPQIKKFTPTTKIFENILNDKTHDYVKVAPINNKKHSSFLGLKKIVNPSNKSQKIDEIKNNSYYDVDKNKKLRASFLKKIASLQGDKMDDKKQNNNKIDSKDSNPTYKSRNNKRFSSKRINNIEPLVSNDEQNSDSKASQSRKSSQQTGRTYKSPRIKPSFKVTSDKEVIKKRLEKLNQDHLEYLKRNSQIQKQKIQE